MPCSGARSGAMRSGGSRHGIADHARSAGIRGRSAGWRQARRARRRHQDHRPRHLRRRLAFRRAVRDHPPHQVHRRISRACAGFIAREHVGRAGRRPAAQHGRQRQPAHAVGPRLRPQPRAARPADPAVGRALVDPGGRAGDDRGRRQPRPPRRESRRARRRAHPPGRDRRAGQSRPTAVRRSARGPSFHRFAERRPDRDDPRPREHWFAENRAGRPARQLCTARSSSTCSTKIRRAR